MELNEAMMPNVTLLDLKDSECDLMGIVALVQIDLCSKSVCYEIELNLKYMGITKESEYEMELTKDFIRSCRDYYWHFQQIPTKEEMKWMIERFWYGCEEYANKQMPIYKHQSAPTLNLKKWYSQITIR